MLYRNLNKKNMVEEIKNKVETLKKEYEKAMWDLGVEYASYLFNQSGIQPGDIIISTVGDRILFEKRGLRINIKKPEESYYALIGKRLKKDNTPRKDNTTDSIYYSNVKEVIKNDIKY